VGAIWHPKAVRRIHQDAGAFQGGGRKIVWHTTEGTSLPNYGGSAPHFTLDPSDGRLWQHIPLSNAARAMKGGGPNFWNTVQVELIGFADTAQANKLGVPERAVVNWPAGHYAHIAGLARWIESNFTVPRTCSVKFVDRAAHLGSLDKVKAYTGHIGHQHVDGNDHWDPGLLKIDLILGGPADTGVPETVPRDLGRGDSGDDVKALQAILVKRGYPAAQKAGVFDRDTEAYVVHFQWKHKLNVDGVVGGNTRTAIGLVLGPSAGEGTGGLQEIPGLELGGGDPLEDHVDMPADGSEGRIDKASALLAAPRATAAQLEAYMLARPHGTYGDDKVSAIVGLYVKTATPVGLDPLLVTAQMILETGNLSSDWSQPPRRNPAGIGVTGEPGKGISFPTWRAAVRAHVGRLLAYCIREGAETSAQLKLIDEALAWRTLPKRLRGSTTSLNDLAGTWAADTQYATKIVRVAKEITKPPV
jgi:hypothetical protein